MKFDPYQHKEKYLSWKKSLNGAIPGISETNSKIVLEYLFSIEFDGGDVLNHHLFLDVVSKEEYNSEIRERMGFVSGIILISLFSVFSAISNLKKIIN